MKFLSENDILEVISDYITDIHANYSIMLSGDWGAGKTYFVKKTLIPEYDKRIKSIYVSLFGVKDGEDIGARVYTAMIERRIGKKLLPVLKIAGDLVAKYTKLPNSSEIDSNSLSPYVDYSSYFFIFDDLERTSMPVNDVLGYINYFVEQNEAKVLIVANDEEMGNLQDINSYLLKYVVASNTHIDWSTERDINTHTLDMEKQPKVKLAEIKKRMDMISDERARYKIIKEKLIGKTFYFVPNLELIIESLFSKVVLPDIKQENLENECITIINRIMKENKYYNLRTLQFSLSYFSRIVKDIPEIKENDISIYKEVILNILTSVIYISIKHKRGESILEWPENAEFGIVDLNGKMAYTSYTNSFKFIYDYVYYGVYSKDRVRKVLQEYISIEHKNYKMEKLKSLQYYWEMDDEEIIRAIEELYRDFQKSKGEGYSYQSIITLLFQLKDCGLEPVDISKFVNIMKENMSYTRLEAYMKKPYEFTNSELAHQYKEILDMLSEGVQVSDNGLKIQRLKEILNSGVGWGAKFYNYYYENIHTLYHDGLLKYINIDNLVDVLSSSKVLDISDFRRTLPDAYPYLNRKDYSHEEIESLIALRKKLEKEYHGKIKQLNIKLLCEFIDQFLLRIEVNQNE